MSLAVYPQFRDIALDDASLMRPFLEADESGMAEYAFANLYLFRAAHRYRCSTWQGLLLVLAQGYDGRPYAFPPIGRGDVAAALRKLAAVFPEGVRPRFFPVSPAQVNAWFASEGWQVQERRDQADYLYRRDDLATLAGKKYHKRRNRLAKFLRELDAPYHYRELSDEHLGPCLALAQGWCEIRCSPQRPSTYLETAAAVEGVQLRRQLGLRGGVIEVAGAVRAFCLGEPLTADTFVVHFEKTEPGREGLAQLINRDFCRHSLRGYDYVNREQDLGDPGLRHAKESYHPLRMVEKYQVEPR